jgi:hypothetical protein
MDELILNNIDTGSEITLDQLLVPVRVYFPSSENDFSFFCDYSPPVGNINFIFPDSPCSSLGEFDFYSGVYSDIEKIIIGDFILDGYLGQTLLDFELATYLLLPIETSYSGSELDLSIYTYTLLDSDSYSGEELNTDLTVPVILTFDSDAYSGEELNSSLAISYILSSDSYSGEELNSSLEIYLSIPLSIDSYSGEELVSFDIIKFTYLPIDSYSGEELNSSLEIYLSIPLSIDSYSGEELNSSLAISYILSSDIYSGEELSFIELSTYPSISLETVNSYSGNNVDTSLSTVSLLATLDYVGINVDVVLTTFIPQVLVLNSYSGILLESILNTTDALNSLNYVGNNSDIVLSTYPSISLDINAYFGVYSNVSIQEGITFPNISYQGIYSSFDLSYLVNAGTIIEIYDGEELFVDALITQYAIQFDGFNGLYSDVYLGTEEQIDSEGYFGIESISILTLNPPDELSPIGYNGDTLDNFVLNTTTILPNIGYAGIYSSFVLLDNPSGTIESIGYVGNNVILDIQISVQIPLGRAYNGINSSISSMDNEPNWYVICDETLETILATSDVFSVKEYGTGVNVYSSLSVGKSGPIGSFTFYNGQVLYPGLNVKYHADLYVLFRTSLMTQCDIGSATYFDLGTDSCCGPRLNSNNIHFNMSQKDYLPEAVSYGNRVNLDINLSVAKRFKFDMYSGESSYFVDSSAYLELDFYSGIMSNLQFDADELHRLCKGYFIPNGNWLVVEMDDVLSETCYTDRIYTGEELICNLSDDIVLRKEADYIGEGIEVNLTTYPPWLIDFRPGENLFVVLSLEQALYPSARMGENCYVKFYEPDWPMYFGQYSEVELVTEYKIRFKEEGCFDNEFVFQNEDGDEIPELFVQIPIEGEPYYHSVLAECF